jgi:hypothetical protein
VFEKPPPGAGFVTTTANVPVVARSLAVRAIVSWVELMKVRVCAMPLKVTVEFERKPVPVIVKFCGVALAGREAGERDAITGRGFPTVTFTAFDAPPPGAGFVTTTGNEPAVARSLVVSEIVS